MKWRNVCGVYHPIKYEDCTPEPLTLPMPCCAAQYVLIPMQREGDPPAGIIFVPM